MGVSPQNSESLNKPGRWLLGIHKFETSMQGGYLWRDMDTTTMTGLNFDGLYQQQGLNTNVLPRFELNSVQSNTVSKLAITPVNWNLVPVKLRKSSTCVRMSDRHISHSIAFQVCVGVLV